MKHIGHPVKHSKIKFSMLEAKIDNTIAWQKNHWRSIQSSSIAVFGTKSNLENVKQDPSFLSPM